MPILCAADFKQLMELATLKDFDELFSEELNPVSVSNDVIPACSVPDHPGLETRLQIERAEFITELAKKVSDDPEHACCSCECLCQRKNV